LTFGGTNVPDTYSATTTFSSTPVLVDNGKVKIWQKQVTTSADGEWDIFYTQIVDGGPLAGNIDADWNITMDYNLSKAASFDAVFQQWVVNGTPVGPLTNGIGSICCAEASNPIVPGWSYYNSGFNVQLAAGTQTNWQQIYVDPYSLVSDGGINPSSPNEFIFGLHFTLQPALPTVNLVISASAYGAFPTFGSSSWIEIYGTNLGVGPQGWSSANFTGINAPTTLVGTSVTIGGQSAFVDYVNSTQVNVQVPAGINTGAQNLVVTTAAGSSAPFPVTVVADNPGLLAPSSFDIGGTQYVVAQSLTGEFVLPSGAISGVASQPAKPGQTIVIYGIGFGSVTPTIPPGQLAQGDSTLALPFTISIGGKNATVSYDGLSPDEVGVYQFDVVVPDVAAGDKVPVTFTLGGVNGTQQNLFIAVGN
jgi:uncharacterized protein (TIGR03437 family)